MEHSDKSAETVSDFGKIFKIDANEVRSHIDSLVRECVEDTLNSPLEAEADELCGAKKYERSESRRDTRAGHYTRNLATKAGEVELMKKRPEPFGNSDLRRILEWAEYEIEFKNRELERENRYEENRGRI